MTRVDFYLIGDDSSHHWERVACTLTSKAWKDGHQVYLNTSSSEHAARLDKLLWTWRDISFLPHGRFDQAPDPATPILVGHGDQAPDFSDVLINLHHSVPLFFSRFDRVLEVVPTEEALRQQARQRYRFYQDRGYTLETHHV